MLSKRNMAVVLGLTAASVLFVYPSFSNAYNNIKQTREISGYESGLEGMEDVDIEAEKERAIKYNEEIFKEQNLQVFSYRGAAATDEEYESLLNMGTKKTMCILEVPEIELNIPVAHGTKEEDLHTQAGHMYGTSLPIGGENTNALITGHTGLTNARIFSDLEKLEEEDTFLIHVLDETHAYRIKRRVIVLPEDEIPYLQIIQGRDEVTLYTCTPYGVNSHRLILTGERDLDLEKQIAAQSNVNTTVMESKQAKILTAILGMIPILVLFISATILKKVEKKEKIDERCADDSK